MAERRPPALALLIDAFRHDYLEEAHAPELSRLAAGAVARPMKPPLAYSDGIRAMFFTGRQPDETGYWMEYCYRPETSPWHGLSRFAPLDRFPSDFVLRGAKLATSMTVMPQVAKARHTPHLSLRHMPFRAIDKFDFTLDRPMTAPGAFNCETIFDACTASGRPWAYLDASKTKPRALLAQLAAVPDDVGLIFVYLHQVDMASHLFGIDSPLFWRAVRRTDAFTGEVLRSVRRRFGVVPTFAFSDHGMSTLTKQIAIPELTLHPGFPDRFFVALDATMVRLWYLDESESLVAELRERVADRYPGRFLSAAEKVELHLDFSGRLYGDDIFLLEPGIGIFPNFHSFIKPKAMHAYHPDVQEQWGIFVGPDASTEPGVPVQLPEISTAVLDAIGPRSITNA